MQSDGNGILLLAILLIGAIATIRQLMAAGWGLLVAAMLIAAVARGAIHEATAAILAVGGLALIAAHHGMAALQAVAEKLLQVDRVATHFARKIPAPEPVAPVGDAVTSDADGVTETKPAAAPMAASARHRRHM